MGCGISGVAYKCFIHDGFYVVKVPKRLANAVLALNGQLPSSMPLNQREFNALCREKAHVERLLQPMAYNEALFTAEQVEDFTAQRKIMRTHLGFSHVHRVVHIELNPDAGYPMLISVFCEPFALCTSLHRFRVSFGRLTEACTVLLDACPSQTARALG